MSVVFALALALATPAVAADDASPGPAQVVIHPRLSGPQLTAILAEAGLRHEPLHRDGRGAWVRVIVGRWPVIVQLADEVEGAAARLHLYAGFDGRQPPTLQAINAFNASHRFGRAYVDAAGDPVLEGEVDLTGGVPPAHVVAHLRRFGEAVEAFATKVVGLE